MASSSYIIGAGAREAQHKPLLEAVGVVRAPEVAPIRCPVTRGIRLSIRLTMAGQRHRVTILIRFRLMAGKGVKCWINSMPQVTPSPTTNMTFIQPSQG